MTKIIRFFSIIILLIFGSLANAMCEKPENKMFRGIESNNLVLIEEAFIDFLKKFSHIIPHGRFIDNNYCDLYGTNFLILASKLGHIEAAENLIKFGANINIADIFGDNALSYAICNDNIKLVQMLVNAGASINDYLKHKPTPLMQASYSGKLNIVKFLISKDAIINNKDAQGFTAIDIARKEGHMEIVDFLEKQLAMKRDFLIKNLSEHFPKGVDKMITEYIY